MAQRPTLARRARATLLALNAAGALVATGFAAAGAIRPSIARPRSASAVNDATQFWAASSAIRTLAVTGPLLVSLISQQGPSPHIITAAGIVQIGDAGLGLHQRNTVMTIAPAAMGVIHLITAQVLLRGSRAAGSTSH